MIIVEKPYASEFLIDTIVQHDWGVLSNEAIKNANIEDGAFNLIDSERAKRYYECQEFPLIYSNSENAVSWVLENLPNNNLASYITFFKDKLAFRELLKTIYPDFFFTSVDFDGLDSLNPDELKFPFVIKPSVGFLSCGVHTVNDQEELKNAVNSIKKEMEQAKKLYPQNVVNSSKFIIEEMICGEEYAIDAYYDRNGEPVILNIFQHPFLNDKDVSDRLYLTSTSIMIKNMSKFVLLLKQISELKNIRNFPFHIELRITTDGNIIPIEVNPMRFAGWCTTEVAKYAWGINVYDCFFNQIRPDWNQILSKAGQEFFYFSMAEVPMNINRKKIEGFEYDRFLSNYSNILELRRINYQENPLFAIIFGSLTSTDEIHKILSLKTSDYIIKSE